MIVEKFSSKGEVYRIFSSSGRDGVMVAEVSYSLDGPSPMEDDYLCRERVRVDLYRGQDVWRRIRVTLLDGKPAEDEDKTAIREVGQLETRVQDALRKLPEDVRKALKIRGK